MIRHGDFDLSKKLRMRWGLGLRFVLKKVDVVNDKTEKSFVLAAFFFRGGGFNGDATIYTTQIVRVLQVPPASSYFFYLYSTSILVIPRYYQHHHRSGVAGI